MTDIAMLGASSYERNARDLYSTEPAVTHSLCQWLLDRSLLSARDVIWEPACGEGAMVRVLGSYFSDIVASDIVPLCDDAFAGDFLECRQPCNAILTNPPYGDHLDLFHQRALELLRDARTKPLRLIGFVARSEVNHASTRRSFFGDCPEYLGKLILTWRPWWVERKPGDKSPRFNYAVYLWARVGCYTEISRPLEGYLHRPAKQGTMPACKEAA